MPPILQEQSKRVLNLALHEFWCAWLSLHNQGSLKAIGPVEAGMVVPEVRTGHLVDLELVGEAGARGYGALAHVLQERRAVRGQAVGETAG